jgi:hypothetical protein
LMALFGDRLSVSQAIREQHCNTTTWVAGTPPDAVAFPRSAEEAQQSRAHLRPTSRTHHCLRDGNLV